VQKKAYFVVSPFPMMFQTGILIFSFSGFLDLSRLLQVPITVSWAARGGALV